MYFEHKTEDMKMDSKILVWVFSSCHYYTTVDTLIH